MNSKEMMDKSQLYYIAFLVSNDKFNGYFFGTQNNKRFTLYHRNIR